MNARDELAAILREQGGNNLQQRVIDASVDAILAAGYRKMPDPEIEWGVASKWGSHPYGTKERAVDQLARHHASTEDARLIKRWDSIKPGPWEDA